VWFLWGVLPLLTLPWSPWLLATGRRLWAGGEPATIRRWHGLLVWWALVVVLFFSLPASKLVGYIMPALAPFCALLALPFTDPASRARRWLRGMVAGAALLSLGLVAALAWIAPKSGQDVAASCAAWSRRPTWWCWWTRASTTWCSRPG